MWREGGDWEGGTQDQPPKGKIKGVGKSTNYQVSGKRKESGECVQNERKRGVGVAGVRGKRGEEQGRSRRGGKKRKGGRGKGKRLESVTRTVISLAATHHSTATGGRQGLPTHTS